MDFRTHFRTNRVFFGVFSVPIQAISGIFRTSAQAPLQQSDYVVHNFGS